MFTTDTDDQEYLELLVEDDPYGPEFVPFDEDEYEYTGLGD